MVSVASSVTLAATLDAVLTSDTISGTAYVKNDHNPIPITPTIAAKIIGFLGIQYIIRHALFVLLL